VGELLLAAEQGRGAAAGRPWSRKVEVGRRWKKDAEHRGFGRPGCWPRREEHGKSPWEKLELAAMGKASARRGRRSALLQGRRAQGAEEVAARRRSGAPWLGKEMEQRARREGRRRAPRELGHGG
jgi:hypothetical protein